MKFLLYGLLYLATAGIIASSLLLAPHPVDTFLLTLFRLVILCFASLLLVKYTFYMVLSPWFASRERKQKFAPPHRRPLISVMIPAWNEEVGLLSTIKSLLASTYRPLELVVINDGSTDKSDEMMRQFLRKYALDSPTDVSKASISYYYQKNAGKGAALNTAIARSHGDILVSIDADCIVSETAIAAFVEAFRDPNVAAAVGNVKIGNTKTLIGTIQALEFAFSFYFKKADGLLNTIYIIGGAAGAFRREVFTLLGGYSTSNVTEDIELSVRIQNQGWKIAYAHDAVVYTEGATTLYGLMKQRLRWKRGRIQTFAQYRSLFFSWRRQHNKLLTWCVLPLAFFGDMQLAFEPFFIALLFGFSWASNDFSPFISGIIIVSLMFFIQALDARHEQHWAYMLLAPIGWCLFYVTTFVEMYALTKSILLLIRKKELKWQKWQRTGM